MTYDENKREAEHRRNIERYRYLLGFVRDPEMRAKLEKLLEDAQKQLAEIKSKQREAPAANKK